MDELVISLKRDFPTLSFQAGRVFCWSPKQQEIFYRENSSGDTSKWALLHELSHALLGHKTYNSDFELLCLEVAAWDKAKEIGAKYGQQIDPEHIQNCLDTYREWLHRRSTCPACGNGSFQQNATTYGCFNCHATWKVTAARFCRPYRRIHALPKNEKSLEPKAPATFM